jgi:acetyltransferase-like isoleucine patch superfamily enzyme
VIRDVPPRALMVGNPARQIREVPDEELLGGANET